MNVVSHYDSNSPRKTQKGQKAQQSLLLPLFSLFAFFVFFVVNCCHNAKLRIPFHPHKQLHRTFATDVS
jgi:hypothetical protein